MNNKTKDFPTGLLIERNWISYDGKQQDPTEYYVLLSESDGTFVVLDLTTQKILFQYSASFFFAKKMIREIYQVTLIWPDGWESKGRQDNFLYEMKKKLIGTW